MEPPQWQAKVQFSLRFLFIFLHLHWVRAVKSNASSSMQQGKDTVRRKSKNKIKEQWNKCFKETEKRGRWQLQFEGFWWTETSLIDTQTAFSESWQWMFFSVKARKVMGRSSGAYSRFIIYMKKRKYHRNKHKRLQSLGRLKSFKLLKKRNWFKAFRPLYTVKNSLRYRVHIKLQRGNGISMTLTMAWLDCWCLDWCSYFNFTAVCFLSQDLLEIRRILAINPTLICLPSVTFSPEVSSENAIIYPGVHSDLQFLHHLPAVLLISINLSKLTSVIHFIYLFRKPLKPASTKFSF